ncbi:sensor histidine kinase [Runella zeae]|jgi:two-component system NtrC family sensor kinase|uniref:sensor histidine kinase n=1 Tax=Runella zeae TaxID=94255 RepID=UPI0004017D81|nr:HAMP domain-containing sensor histidine kinase [Runella zeae]
MEKANQSSEAPPTTAFLPKEQQHAHEDDETFKERFVQLNKLAEIGQLTAGIMHEIQNPLNFINNFSKLSVDLVHEMKEIFDKKQDTPLTEEEEDLLFLLDKLVGINVKISENGGRITRIIQSMLAQTRTENQSAKFEPVDLNQLLEEFTKLAYQGVRGEDKAFNVSFVFQFDPSVGKVKLAATEISRVVLNLVNNACYALNEKRKREGAEFAPQISVSSTRLAQTVQVKIKDNGNGIPDSIKEKVFSPFFTTKPVGKGSGLGLALSRDIITIMHKGQLEVVSEEGKFTEFTIQIPLDLS